MSGGYGMRVLIAIVTYNSAGVIRECLENFRPACELTEISTEICVTDNVSSDETRDIVRAVAAENPGMNIRLVRSPKNDGWGAGTNRAIHNATVTPDYVLICNPDASISADGLLRLVEALETTQPMGGIAVPYLRTGSGTILGANREWTSAKYVIGDLGVNQWMERRFQKHYTDRHGVFEIPRGYASGAVALLSYRALEEAGFCDESIFLYHDDIDFTRSILQRGYRLVAHGDAVGSHDTGHGSRIDEASTSPTTAAVLERESEFVFVEKWHGRSWAKALAWYRWHVFYRLQAGLYRASGRPTPDNSALRAPAGDYLFDR